MRRMLFALLSAALGLTLTILSYTSAAGLGFWTDLLRLGGLAIFILSCIELIYRIVRRRRARESPEVPPPEKEKPVYAIKKNYLSRTERAFMEQLKKIKPERYAVIPQVALVTVIDKLTMNSYRNELFRVIDFMFADKETYEPLLLVELNDSSHLKAERAERDKKVNEIVAGAGMPLVTFWTNERNSPEDVRKTVLKHIKK